MNSKVVVISIFALQFAIASIASGAAGAAKEINFGWPSGEGWSSQPYKVAQDKGFFEREGLRVRMITFRGTNLMLAALCPAISIT